MRNDTKQKLAQATASLLGLTVVWDYASGLGATEFGGGRITGPLLDMKEVGTFLFIPALLLTFFYRRIAAAISLVASLLCLPLFLYFTAPGPFRWVLRGEYSVPAQANFVWNKWGITGVLVLAVAAYFGVRSFLVQRQTHSPTH